MGETDMRIALVTGGAGGLGVATAKQFVKDGMTVVIADIDGKAAEKAAASLEGKGHRGIELDAGNEQAVINAFEQIESSLGPIAVLTLFAGKLGKGGTATGLVDASLDDWDDVFALNARGTFICVREMARWRRKLPVQDGRIITVSSLAGQVGGLQGGVAYSASKAAILGITRTAARDLASLGITVNAIAPGPIDTAMLAQPYNRFDAIPLGRVGTPQEVAAAASFLASVNAGYVTGSTIDVNGGISMH